MQRCTDKAVHKMASPSVYLQVNPSSTQVYQVKTVTELNPICNMIPMQDSSMKMFLAFHQSNAEHENVDILCSIVQDLMVAKDVTEKCRQKEWFKQILF